MVDQRSPLTAYEVLRVHPSAPADLVSACYWDLARGLRDSRDDGSPVELHALTRAYEAISDPGRREAYDKSIGYDRDTLVTRSLPRKRLFLVRWLSKRNSTWRVDPHEVLGLHPSASQATVPEAYRLMRNGYLRLPRGQRREALLKMVDEAYVVLGDPERRASLILTNTSNGATEPASMHPGKSRADTRRVAKPKPERQQKPERQHRKTKESKPARSTTGSETARSNLAPGGESNTVGTVIGKAGRGVKAVGFGLGHLFGWLARSLGGGARAGAGAISRGLGRAQSNRARVRESRQQPTSAMTADDLFLGRLASSVGDSEARNDPPPAASAHREMSRSENDNG